MKVPRERQGFTLVEIMVVVAIVGLLAGLAIPAVMNARKETRTSICTNNLRQIHQAKEQWAYAASVPTDALPTWTDLAPYIKKSTKNCYCPADPTRSCSNSYDINDLATEATCKIVSWHAY